MVTTIALVALLAVCTWTDLREGKIYNRYILPALLLGVALNAWLAGWPGVRGSLLGMGIVAGLGLTVINLGQFGPGDIKLLMAVGALKGAAFLWPAGLATALAGGVLAVALLIRRKRMPSAGTLAWALTVNMGNKGALAGMLDAGKMPYSIPIAIGCITALLLGGG